MNQSQILVVDDDSQLREAIVDTLMLTGYACLEASSGEEALSILLKRKVDMVIADIQMDKMDGHTLLRSIRDKYPQIPVLLMTAYANIDGAVRAMRDGAIDYLAKPFAPEVLLNQVSRYVPVKRITKREPIWADPSTGELLQLALKVAATDATVMITGPSGSGKEVLSRYVHDNSNRASGPFIAINCAAIPDTMLESTLFGYEKGAFTGAVQACPGKFEQAQGGTILLDEITEMDLNLQSKLLRVLQEREVERLGGRKTISLDVRVIATSNRDLKQAVAENKFREDLYYRLNVFPLRWKPLCQRKKDVLPLAKFFLQRHASENSRPIPKISDEAVASLEAYAWPGNVRELENVMQRAMILCEDNVVKSKDLILDDSISSSAPLAMTAGVEPHLYQEQQQKGAMNPVGAGVAGVGVGAAAGAGAGAGAMGNMAMNSMDAMNNMGNMPMGSMVAPNSMGGVAAMPNMPGMQGMQGMQGMGGMGAMPPQVPASTMAGQARVSSMSPSDFARAMSMGGIGMNQGAAVPPNAGYGMHPQDGAANPMAMANMGNMAGMNNMQPNTMGSMGAMAMGSGNGVNGAASVSGVAGVAANAAAGVGSGAGAASGAAVAANARKGANGSELSAAATSSLDIVRNQKIPSSLGGELKQQEYQIILDALIDCRGNRQAVADKLGISPRTLRYKIAKMRDEGMIIPS